ncbi:zinc metalloproteinase-disintegrin-like ohanin isoform X2 [Varanus komodoensis]|uniref:zinc metalloproteinase-disintegrin-like ohanin isoform X2 n=1 Tax=Varanus komodoensis TaxID=61221 RepID=UPI001CF77B3A|nr:zinc metalloproteinase-disintegrin-like ohanin isoform X2 [Varanus komodoensis]
MIKAVFVITCLVLIQHQGSTMKEPPGVEDYKVVYPKKLHALHKRDVKGIQNPQEKAKYEDTVQYEIEVNGEKVVLHLEKNRDLFSKDYTETHSSHDGKEITTSPQTEDHCYYGGHIQGDTSSGASISTCRGLRGYFKSRGKRYLIEPLKLLDSEAHAVFKYESLEKEDEAPKVCGVTNTTWQMEEPIQKIARSSTSAEFRKYSRNLNGVKTRVYEIVNYINLVYKAINIHVALIGLEIWSEGDKIIVDESASVTLDRFSEWRQDVLLKRRKNDNAQLLTGIDFNGPTVGLAYVGTMCNPSHSLGIVQDHSTNPIAIGATMAHEMGHNFGMNHDTNFCTCNSGSCIMAAQLSYNTPQYFSSCSLQDFQKYILERSPACIVNMPLPQDIVAKPVCGNDFVEEGEECDCGSPEECKNECCDAATCKLKPGAKCGFGECCENCQLRAAGAVCRPAKHDCDLPDLCTGHSHQCPADRFRVNGHPCMNHQGYCYMGQCPTLQNQCTALWGTAATVASDSCFAINKNGVYYGHCKKANGTFLPCGKKDLKCGKLYCTGGSRMPSAGSLVTFENCKGSFPSGTQEDGGMVADGTKCGESMVCNDGQCVDIEKVYRSTNCSNQCRGHAVCDHELQCQCEEGWAPPNCDDAISNRYIIIIVAVLAVLLSIAVAITFLFRCQILRKKGSPSTHKRVAGATNLGFSGQEQRIRQNAGPTPGPPEVNSARCLLPPPPPQANKPSVCVVKIPGEHPPAPYENARMPIIKPNVPPPPVPTAKPALSPATGNSQTATRPVPSPHFKSKPAPPPPPPPQALKPPGNRKV